MVVVIIPVVVVVVVGSRVFTLVASSLDLRRSLVGVAVGVEPVRVYDPDLSGHVVPVGNVVSWYFQTSYDVFLPRCADYSTLF